MRELIAMAQALPPEMLDTKVTALNDIYTEYMELHSLTVQFDKESGERVVLIDHRAVPDVLPTAERPTYSCQGCHDQAVLPNCPYCGRTYFDYFITRG